MKALPIVLAVFLLLPSLAHAEIEKVGYPCSTGICLYWWPKLPPLKGWHHEHESSLQNGSNCLAPDGSSFADAETVIYGRAIYIPRSSETPSLDALIQDDKQGFLEATPDAVISAAPAIATADGQRLTSFTFFPKSTGNWECVSYGKEDEYFLIFVVSSRSLAAYKQALPAYKALIAAYRKLPLQTEKPRRQGEKEQQPVQ